MKGHGKKKEQKEYVQLEATNLTDARMQPRGKRNYSHVEYVTRNSVFILKMRETLYLIFLETIG